MRVFAGRRPEVLLLMSMMIFVAALVGRFAWKQPAPQIAINTDAPPPAPLGKDAEQTIAEMQGRLRTDPENVVAYTQLGAALLQRVRETADASLYVQAGQAFDQALKRDPKNIDALVGQGSLALSRHQFAEAQQWADQARTQNPYRALIYGIIGDSQLERGQYDVAEATFQKMVNLRPDLSSYSRVSYIRELHGDTDGAIKAMQMAVQAGGPATENSLWTQVQLGNLYFNRGDLQTAEQTYITALQLKRDYIYAFAGVAKVRAAQGKYDEAISYYKKIVEQLPLPEFVIALGELYEVTGKSADAKAQYDLVRAMQQLNANAGMDVDMELALFDADHGADPAKAIERARTSYAKRASIYGADALAWALYQHHDYAEAQRYSNEALKLGTRDAALHYRAGMIALANNDKTKAHDELKLALDMNPYFSIRYAPQAKKLLASLAE